MPLISGSPQALRRKLVSGLEHQGTESLLDKSEWHAAVESAVAQAEEYGQPLAVVFIDVNHFKDINDSLGHVIGDEVIDGIKNILAGTMRDSDPGHIGGDEFGILCRTDEQGVQALVDRLRETFDGFVEGSENGLRNLDVSLAIGIGVFEPGLDAAALLKLADKDMYDDKLRQLAPLNDRQEKLLLDFQAMLEENEIRIRDVGKYLLKLSGPSYQEV